MSCGKNLKRRKASSANCAISLADALTCQPLSPAQLFQRCGKRAVGAGSEEHETYELDATVDALLGEVLQNGPAALGEVKALFAQLEVGPVTDAVRELTAQTISRVRMTDEAREGFQAFFDKRPAAWIRP